MKRLLLAILLFSSLAARSQCDTMRNATFSSITTNSVVVTIVSPGVFPTNWTGFAVTLYDSITNTVAFQTFVTSKTFTATGLTANRTYKLGVVTFLNSTFCSPTIFNKYVKTASAVVGYTPMNGNGYKYNRIAVDSTFHLPLQDTTLNRGLTRAGALVVRPQDSSLYVYNGSYWVLAGGSSSGLIPLINSKIDSVVYSGDTLYYYKNGVSYGTVTNLAGKLNISDTAAMLSPYQTAINAKPTFGDVRDIVHDTALTLVPYTGATQDVDLGDNNLSAKSLSATGTGGNGHIHLKFQSATPTGTGSSSTLYAYSTGRLKYKNNGGATVYDLITDQDTSGMLANKVSKWERWTDTLFIQKYDTSKTALTIRIDSNSTTKPTIQILDSINRTLFEMRALPIKFGSVNTAIGIGAGQKIVPKWYNSPTYGYCAGGTSNTFLGDYAGNSLIDGNENTGIGHYALKSLIGSNGGDPNFIGSLNTAVGSYALGALTTGTSNTGLGQKALASLTTGNQNVAIGKAAGEAITTTSGNVFIGGQAGKFSSTSGYTTAIGGNAGLYGGNNYNVLIGTNAGANNYGSNHTFISGGDSAAYISDVYFGRGDFSPIPIDYTIHGTNAYGSNLNGANLYLTAGRATGSATSGKTVIQVGKQAGSGTQSHYLTDAVTIAPITNSFYGGLAINNSTPTKTFEVLNPTTGRTSSDTLANFNSGGSFDVPNVTTYSNYSGSFVSNATLRNGNGTLANIGLYASATSGKTNYAAILDSGNVGIGTKTPTYKLDVNGVTRLNSKLIGTSIRVNKDSILNGGSSSFTLGVDTLTGEMIRVAAGGTGTVTSVATGLGLTGGTITTSGTVSLDTSNASVLSRQRAANTYGALASANTWLGVNTFTAPKITDTLFIGSAAYSNTAQIRLATSSGTSLIKQNGGTFGFNNGATYGGADFQFNMGGDNTTGTLEMYNSVVRSKRLYINGINFYTGGSIFQVNGSGVIGNGGTAATAPTNGLTVIGKTLIGSNTDNNNGQLQVTGSLSLNTAGSKLNIATGTNASVGTATLSSGTVTVNTTAVTANSIILLTLQNCSNCGSLYISAKTAGTSFAISSTNALDGSIAAYQIIN